METITSGQVQDEIRSPKQSHATKAYGNFTLHTVAERVLKSETELRHKAYGNPQAEVHEPVRDVRNRVTPQGVWKRGLGGHGDAVLRPKQSHATRRMETARTALTTLSMLSPKQSHATRRMGPGIVDG